MMKRLDELLSMKDFKLIDVGAAKGIDKKWKILGPKLVALGFEPNREGYEDLNNVSSCTGTNEKYLNIALDKVVGRMKLFILREKEDSSKYEPNYNFLKRFPRAERFDMVGTEMVKADKLDNVVMSENMDRVDFIKIDTQGSELDILKGAEDTLCGSVSGIKVEVCFSPLYKEQPLFADVDNYLRILGFNLFDLTRSYWKRGETPYCGEGQLIFADALYFKDYIAMDSFPPEIGPPIIMAIIHKKYDYAIELMDYFYDGELVDLCTKNMVISTIHRYARPVLKMPRFKGRARLAGLAEKFSILLRDGCTNRSDAWR